MHHTGHESTTATSKNNRTKRWTDKQFNWPQYVHRGENHLNQNRSRNVRHYLPHPVCMPYEEFKVHVRWQCHWGNESTHVNFCSLRRWQWPVLRVSPPKMSRKNHVNRFKQTPSRPPPDKSSFLPASSPSAIVSARPSFTPAPRSAPSREILTSDRSNKWTITCTWKFSPSPHTRWRTYVSYYEKLRQPFFSSVWEY